MSVHAMEWVSQQCDADDYVSFRIMVLLAGRADEDGRGAWPSIATMAKAIRRTPRTVQRGLDRLRETGRIRRGDQTLIPPSVPANRRPVVWDIVIPGVTPVVTPDGDSEATQDVTPTRSGVTQGDTPDDALGVTSDVDLGVTSDVLQTVLHSLRNETVLAPTREDDPVDDDTPIEPPATPKPKKATRKKTATSLPDDWKPNETHNVLARELGLSAEQARLELENFRDKAIAKGYTYIDWHAAFRNWLRNAVKFGLRPANGREPSAAPKADPRTGNLVESRW